MLHYILTLPTKPKMPQIEKSEMVIDEDFGHFVKVSTLVKTITPPF